jgi:DNA-binding helix-hairpin-helix protein with protein kinase domain
MARIITASVRSARVTGPEHGRFGRPSTPTRTGVNLMDRKIGAVLAIAVVGLIAGVAGIVIANDAKSGNQDTQTQLDAAVSRENKRVAATAAAAKRGIKKSERNAEAAVGSAEDADKKAAQQNSDQIAELQSTIDDLKAQIAALESDRKSGDQQLNARITALAKRLGG